MKRAVIALAAGLAAAGALAADGLNARGERAVLVSANRSVGMADAPAARRADGVGAIVAIDVMAPGVGQNARGECVFVGPEALVAHLAANNTNIADWAKYD